MSRSKPCWGLTTIDSRRGGGGGRSGDTASDERIGRALSVVASELSRATDRGATRRKAWDLSAAVHKAAVGNIPTKGQRRRSTPWWTPTLTDLKSMVCHAQSDCQDRWLSPQERQDRREGYETIRRIYTRAVKAAKRENWREFVTTETSTNM